MRRLCIALLILCAPLAAQNDQKPAQEKAKVEKLFILKYADPRQVAGVLSIFGGSAVPSRELNALAVTNSPEIMPAIEDAIKRLDVPTAAPQNIELTAYYVVGVDSEETFGQPIPKDLDSVVTQIRNTFPLKNYRLLDTLALRIRSGQGAETSGVASGPAPGLPPTSTQFRVGNVSVNADDSSVRIDKMKAGVRMPVGQPGGSFQFNDLGLNSDFDIKVGQKVVVGRLGLSRDQALFLVLTARVVN